MSKQSRHFSHARRCTLLCYGVTQNNKNNHVKAEPNITHNKAMGGLCAIVSYLLTYKSLLLKFVWDANLLFTIFSFTFFFTVIHYIVGQLKNDMITLASVTVSSSHLSVTFK